MAERRTGLNNPRVSIYELNSTTPVLDPRRELKKAKSLQHETLFPNGLYGGASFRIPRDATAPHYWRGGQRVVIRNGDKTIYEGKIIFIDGYVSEGEQGLQITCAGAWGQTLGKWKINKRWADNRIDADAWQLDTSATATAKEFVGVDRNGRLRFAPSQNDFVENALAAFAYTMPVNETVKRVVLNYDFSERYETQPKAAKLATLTGYDTPKSVKHGVYYGYASVTKVFSLISSVYADRPNTYDGSTVTSNTFTLAAASDTIWVRVKSPVSSIKLNLGSTVNNNVASLSVAIYQNGTLANVTGLSDGTMPGTAMFAQDGVISWTTLTAWDQVTINGYHGYWLRLKPSAALDAVEFMEIEAADSEAYDYTTLTNAFDGSAGTSVSATIATPNRLMVCYEQTTNGTKFDIGTTNTTVTSLAGRYWRGEIETDDGIQDSQWASITISDGTATGGKPLAQDGAITYSDPVNWSATTVDGVHGYWIYFEPASSLTAVTFNEVYCENPEVYSFTDLASCIDGDDTTSESVTIARDQYLYVKVEPPNVGFLAFVFGFLTNSTVATFAMQYYQVSQVASTGIIPAGWADLSISDGTDSGGAPWAQDGDMVFTTPTDWEQIAIDGDQGHWLRLQPSTDLDPAVTVASIQAGITQAWSLRLRDRTGSTSIWTKTASGTGSQDDTLATPRRTLHLEFISKAKQLGEDNGTVYGQVSGIEVYSETGAINLATIAEDVVGMVTGLNSTASKINTPSNPLELMPFITEGSEAATDILARAAQYGDEDFSRWYCQLVASDLAPTPNGKPVLEVAQYPSLTSYDYQLSIYQKNVSGLSLSVDYDYVANRMIMQYTDEEGTAVVLTPDDDSSLMDADSIALYDRRDEVFDLGTASNATALSIGQRILATRKTPRVVISDSIRVRGSILDSNGQPVPASEIAAGQRVRVQNYLDDKIGVTGAYFTFILSGVRYDDEGEIATLQCSLPDTLAAVMAQRGLLNDRLFQL